MTLFYSDAIFNRQIDSFLMKYPGIKFYIVRWPSRVMPNKYFSNLQIHFKPKNLYFK